MSQRAIAPISQLENDVAALRRELAAEARRLKPAFCPVLIVLCGLPGTGKSHLAGHIVRGLPCVIIESDRLRKVLAPQPSYTPTESARLFAACHQLLAEYLGQGLRVIFDATNLAEAHREPLYRIADAAGAPLLLLHCVAPREVVRRRLAQRSAGGQPGGFSDADWLIHCRMRANLEPIPHPHIEANTAQDIRPVVSRIIQTINRCERERAQGRPVLGEII